MLSRPRPLPLRYAAAACIGLLLPALAHAADGDPPAEAPPATTAPPPAPSNTPPQPEVPPAARETLEARTAFRTMGQDVKGPSGIVVAQLVNILVNAEGQPVAAILDYGGFLGVGKRRIAVAWRALQFTAEGVGLSLSREQLRGLPEFKDGEPAVLAVPPATPVTAEAPANR
jgi:hypothetical protein